MNPLLADLVTDQSTRRGSTHGRQRAAAKRRSGDRTPARTYGRIAITRRHVAASGQAANQCDDESSSAYLFDVFHFNSPGTIRKGQQVRVDRPRAHRRNRRSTV